MEEDVLLRSDGRDYPLRFTSNALFRLERELGRPCQVLLAAYAAGETGVMENQTLLWAGLEGARLKRDAPRSPFTIDEVGDIVDKVPGWWPAVLPLLGEALRRALPRSDVGGGEAAGVDPTIGTTSP